MSNTPRLMLPLLDAGQAQKEMTVNEALARLDLLVQPVVASVGLNIPPDAPDDGDAWIVGGAPTAAWVGQANAMAGWTAGGWRFAAAREGMTVWSVADECRATFFGGAWRVGRVTGAALLIDGVQVVGARRPAIAAASGGTMVDGEARATLAAVLAMLAAHGLIAS